ncbi:MAG: hypothetical protein NZP74_14340 [Anaerolineales bacterium]|nr:hypothetical protein [Anaerolineales bacterium]
MLEVVENDLRPPRKGEARIRVLAASVSLPDVEARYGRSPFPRLEAAKANTLLESGRVVGNVALTPG